MIDPGPQIPQPSQPKAELQPPAGWPRDELWLWDRLRLDTKQFIITKAHGRGVEFLDKWIAAIIARHDARQADRTKAAGS